MPVRAQMSLQAPLRVLHVEERQDGQAPGQRLNVELALLFGSPAQAKLAAALPL